MIRLSHTWIPLLSSAALALGAFLTTQDDPKVGYQDTPVIPGQPWKVHDGTRPQPRVVAAGLEPGAAPSDAIVLFDGDDLDAWKGRNGDAGWALEDGAMVVNGTGGITTRAEFGDCQLHLEFATPSEVKGNSQGRGNSGVFFFGRYEVQVLDSYQNPTYPDGQASALYGQYAPRVNASRAPGEWQTYDIVFEGPKFDDAGAVIKPALVTVIHNGVLAHHARELIGATAHKQVAKYQKHGPKGAIQLQDHGNPVRFRNIWLRELQPTDA